MEERELGNGRRIKSVKAAINMYGGGKINQVTNTGKKSQNDASNSEKSTSKAQELHLAKNTINQIKENRIIAESEKSQAEFELMKAKKLVRELNLHIEQSKSRAKLFQKGGKVEEKPVQEDDDRYEAVTREVEIVKRELSKIKLEIERTVEEKFRAEKEADAAGSRLESYTCSADKLRREIEEAKEEEVLVELAQIQARKELAEIEAQRKEEEERYLILIEKTKRKISVLRDEIEDMKDLEEKLELTNSDADVLQCELNMIKEMDSKFRRSGRMKESTLQSITKDLEAASKELEAIKAKGFQIMSSMDGIRKQMINISKEKDKIVKMEAIAVKSVDKLSSKILRAKDKFEVARASEEKAKSILPTFSLSLEKLNKEKEVAKKEEKKLKEERDNIRAEIQRIESESETNEERLQTVLEELEKVKTAEAKVLEILEALAKNAVKARTSKTKSTITISKFEYEYLTGCAAEAQDIADKKVVAAHAWAEALMANERETKIKTTLVEKEIEGLKLREEQRVNNTEDSENEAGLGTEKLQKTRRQKNKSFQERRRSTREQDYSITPVRQAKFRKSVGSPAMRRMSTSSSLTVKRRRRIMLRFAKYFANKQIENEKSVPLKEDSPRESHSSE